MRIQTTKWNQEGDAHEQSENINKEKETMQNNLTEIIELKM